MLVIKNFSQCIECHSAEMVLEKLQTLKGKSVTIAYTLPSGIVSVIFVSVRETGEVVDTYKKTIIDLPYLTKEFGVDRI